MYVVGALPEVHFVARSCSDVGMKLQRVEEWWSESPEEMMRDAWQVRVRKDKEKVNNLIEAPAELVSAIPYTPLCILHYHTHYLE